MRAAGAFPPPPYLFAPALSPAPAPGANEPILLRALFKTHFFDSSQAERKAGWEKTGLITFLVTRSRSPWPQCGADNGQGPTLGIGRSGGMGVLG